MRRCGDVRAGREPSESVETESMLRLEICGAETEADATLPSVGLSFGAASTATESTVSSSIMA
eukprot:2505296-Prymnesium_polylepis.1